MSNMFKVNIADAGITQMNSFRCLYCYFEPRQLVEQFDLLFLTYTLPITGLPIIWSISIPPKSVIKPLGFQLFSGGIENEHWTENRLHVSVCWIN